VTSSDYSLSAHLTFIQDVIKRLAGNSFLLKGWAITLCSGLIALGISRSQGTLVLVALPSALAFCLLDAFYLQDERRYRALHDIVRLGRCRDDCQHSVPTGEYCLHTDCVGASDASFAEAMKSKSIWVFYSALAATSVGVWLAIR
jgi:hypothetical protein